MSLLPLLSPVVPQPVHPCLTEAQGRVAARLLEDQLGPLTHLRTSEYSVFSAGEVVVRVGHASVASWALEELSLARTWRAAGAPVVVPARPGLLLAGGPVATVWDRFDGVEDGDLVSQWYSAGETLAVLHSVRSGTPGWAPFAARPWRAPGKVARRLVHLDSAHPEHSGLWEGLASRLSSLACTLLDLAGADVVAVHGDYQPCNWLCGPDGFAVVDFATSCAGPRVWDFTLARARTLPGARWSAAHWDALCAGYAASGGVLPTGPAWAAAQSLRTLSTAVAVLTQGVTAPRVEAASTLLEGDVLVPPQRLAPPAVPARP